MKRRLVFALFCVAIILGLTMPMSPVAEAQATVYVPDDYSTIQAAVNAVSPGDTIIVRDGTYTENVVVNKTLTIQSENGADYTTVQAADPTDHVFDVTANYVTVSGLTLKNASDDPWSSGVFLNGVTQCTVSNCVARNNEKGFCLWYSDNCQIIGSDSSDGVGQIGIYLTHSHHNDVLNNITSGNSRGMYIHASDYNRIEGNVASYNTYGYGIDLAFSDFNEILNNTAEANTDCGINFREDAANNYIYVNNLIDNFENGCSRPNNQWFSPQEMSYVYRGSVYVNYLGNYYSDYTGTDADGDGIGDGPYTGGAFTDPYPLVGLYYDGEIQEPSPTPTPTPSPPPDGEGGCFIATAAYGSYLDSHVETLRDFRDSYLVTNPVGQALVSAYYKLSPPVAEFIDEHPALKPVVRVGLLPAVGLSEVAVNTTSTQKVAIVGSLALVYVALAVWLRRRRGKGSEYS